MGPLGQHPELLLGDRRCSSARSSSDRSRTTTSERREPLAGSLIASAEGVDGARTATLAPSR